MRYLFPSSVWPIAVVASTVRAESPAGKKCPSRHIVASAVLLVLSLTGCSASILWSVSDQQSEAAAPLETITETSDVDKNREPPLTVEVAQAFFEEQVLRVKIRLSAKAPLDTQQVAVAVSGLREGDIVEAHAMSVSQATGRPHLLAGQSVALQFSLTQQELTEYQVRCSWGEDAAKLLQESRAKEASFAGKTTSQGVNQALGPVDAQGGGQRTGTANNQAEEAAADFKSGQPAAGPSRKPLALDSVEIEENPMSCSAPPCDLLFTLQLRLVNNSPVVISAARLAVGLYWANDGMLPIIPGEGAAATSSEEIVDLQDLALDPGASKRLRVKIDRSVPTVPGGRFVPHIRLLPEKGS